METLRVAYDHEHWRQATTSDVGDILIMNVNSPVRTLITAEQDYLHLCSPCLLMNQLELPQEEMRPQALVYESAPPLDWRIW